MKFDELDQQMRVFETSHDFCVLPGTFRLRTAFTWTIKSAD